VKDGHPDDFLEGQLRRARVRHRRPYRDACPLGARPQARCGLGASGGARLASGEAACRRDPLFQAQDAVGKSVDRGRAGQARDAVLPRELQVLRPPVGAREPYTRDAGRSAA